LSDFERIEVNEKDGEGRKIFCAFVGRYSDDLKKAIEFCHNIVRIIKMKTAEEI
jgi:hypothetical protein